MIGWLILAAYVVGYFYTARRLTLAQLEQDAQRELKRRYRPVDEPLIDGEDRAMALTMGAMLGLVWPVALTVAVIARRLKVPTEIAEQERRELEQLRALARKHGLPMPHEQGTADTASNPSGGVA